MISFDDITVFQRIFASNETAYGTTVVGDIVDGKAQADSKLVHAAVTPAVLKKHLLGEVSIGLSPMRENGTVRWGAIDIDDYVGNIYDVVDAIWDFQLPLVPCLSKSKKLHVYIFFSEDVDAAECRELLARYAALFRCNSKVEIFPKQSKVSSSYKFFSWINLPYFDASNPSNWRKAVRRQGKYLSIEEFLADAKGKQLSLRQHQEALGDLPYSDAPPCILSGVLLRDVGPGQRNQWLYNVACYLRMIDEEADLEEPLVELNSTLHTPLPEREIRTTVSKVQAKTCYYQCNGMAGCDKKQCRNVEKGIGNDRDSTGINFGQLTQVMTDPPYWTWEVNNVLMTFYSTEDIMNQNSFRKQCMEKLHHTPYKIKDERWVKILNRALENVVEQHVEEGVEFGLRTEYNAAIREYLRDVLVRTTDKRAVFNGRVVEDGDEYMFVASGLQQYLKEVKHIQFSTGSEVSRRLQSLGAYMDGGVWRIPKTAVASEVTVEEEQQILEADLQVEQQTESREENYEF